MPSLNQPNEELSFNDIFRCLWVGRWIVAGCTVGLAAAAFFGGQLLPKEYRAEILITASSDAPGGGGAIGTALASQLGGLASLAGLSESGDAKRQESLATLQSQSLARVFVEKYNLLPSLFHKQWDSSNHRWSIAKLADTPDAVAGGNYFVSRVRTIENDNKTGLTKFTISWRNSEEAARWANDYVALANLTLRQRALDETERNITYLTGEVEKTTAVELKHAIYGLLQNEINRAMVARGSNEFAFRVIDEAIPPRTPTAKAPPRLLALAGALLGLLLSGMFVLIRNQPDKAR